MRKTQGKLLQSLVAAQEFLRQHADQLGDVVNTGARQKLDEAIADLSAHAAKQTESALTSRAATRQQVVARSALLQEHMAAIARIASAEIPASAGIEKLQLPRKRLSTEQLVTYARGMGNAAQPFTSVFVASGLPLDFAAQLNKAADDVAATVTSRNNQTSALRSATTDLAARLRAARRVVRVLDVFVRRALKDQPGLVASWKQAKRVRKLPVRPDTTGPAAASGTPAIGTTPGSATSVAAATPAPSSPPAPTPTAAPPAALGGTADASVPHA